MTRLTKHNLILAAALGLTAHGAAAFDVTETYKLSSPSYDASTNTVESTENPSAVAHVSGWYGTTGTDMHLDNVTSKVVSWGTSGLGINNTSNPGNSNSSGPYDNHHSIDNDDGYEYLAIEFDKDATLDSVKFGWRENDSDFTILYLNSGETFNRHAGSISLSAFSVAASYFGVEGTSNRGVDQTYSLVNETASIASSVWLIAGYNASLGGTRIGNADESTFTDGFKLHSVVTTRNLPIDGGGGSVPAPATLALLGLGGLMLRRREKSKES